MKRVALPALSLTLSLALLGAVDIGPAATPRPHGPRHAESAAGSVGRAVAADSSPARAADDRDLTEIRRRLQRGEAGTYIQEILIERDSALARWPNRVGDPLTVWIQPTSSVNDFDPAFVDEVRFAFEDWDDVHLPVRFRFVRDSAAAEVHVNWIDHFDQPISGRTRWARDDEYLITDANIVLAVHHNQGETLDEDSMRAMALHEIGHLLGLDHTRDEAAIMAPRVRVRELSDADVATARLLYSLPAGPVK